MQTHQFRHLDLNLLRVFDEVMTERSLTRAADKLAITQPAVSNAIRRLREVLGDELLVRSGQGVAPTPLANALWPSVRESLARLQQAFAPDTFDAAHDRQAFVLAMADATTATLLPHLVDILEAEAPQVSLQVQPLTTRDPRPVLDDESADLAVGYFPFVLAEMTARAQAGALVDFESRRLYDGEYICVMRHDHPLAEGLLTLDRYCSARHLLVSFSGQPFGFLDEALASIGRKRRVVLTVNQYFTAARVAAQSDLLTVLPRHMVPITGLAGQLACRPLPLRVEAVHVDALWRTRSRHIPASALAWMLQALERAAKAAFPDQELPL
ncbi:MAG: LysR family transcriptional regulator [Comamonas sp.]